MTLEKTVPPGRALFPHIVLIDRDFSQALMKAAGNSFISLLFSLPSMSLDGGERPRHHVAADLFLSPLPRRIHKPFSVTLHGRSIEI